jgi:hypothetical protein
VKNILVIATLVAFLSSSAFAIYAPRAMGMGGAFTAVADDAFAAYWNPAGFAINPGVDLASSYQLNNRNQQIGDNAFALKGCFEIGMDPFVWIAGVGIASVVAFEGAKYLSDKGVVKKGWGRSGEAVGKEESMAEGVKAEEEKKEAAGENVERQPISRKEIAKKAAKEIIKGTIVVAEDLAEVAVQEAARQTRNYYYAPPWYRPNYYQPCYWDDRYNYSQKELTPSGKAQFAIGLSVMSDVNALLNQNTSWYTLSVASGYEETVALGANLNIYDLELTNFTPKMRGLGAGLDLGGLLRISDKLFFGLTAKDVLTTDIKFENQVTRHYQMEVNAGIALKPFRQATVAADMHNLFSQGGKDRTLHYGVEYKPIYGLALRAGLWDGSKTAGVSIGIEQFIIDYTYLGGAFGRTQTVGITWKI